MSNRSLILTLGIFALLIVASVFALNSIGNGSVETPENTGNNEIQNSYGENSGQQPAEPSTASSAPEQTIKPTLTTMIELTVKDYGKIKIQLDEVNAPLTSANFKKLVEQGFYNNLTFHRIMPGFVAQGGDPEGTGMGGPGYTLPAEIKLPHKRGSVAMARTGDEVNPKRESSGSQFYIALQDLAQLDGAYTVFGQVVEGMDVVDKIAQVKTDEFDKPVTPVVIEKAIIIK